MTVPVMATKAPPESSGNVLKQTDSSEEDESDVEMASNFDESSENESDTPEESSSEESSSEDITPFRLKCLHELDSAEKDEKFKSYFHGPSSDKNKKKIMKRTEKELTTDFTPWWEDHDKEQKKGNDQVTKPDSTPKDADLHESWFNRSQTTGDSSCWIAGPSSTKTGKPLTEVEDIEVPSIYNFQPKEKGRRARKRERKAEREKSAGKNWYNMKAPEVNEKVKMDMEMIRMRGVLDPKRFYKKADRMGLPKYFQMGTVMDEGTDFYSSRLTKKQRKQTLVEELMADTKIRQYNKKKYSELQHKKRGKKFKGNKAS